MAIYIPIVSEFKSAGIDRAKKEFASLSTNGQKAGFLLKKAFLPATAALGAFSGFMVSAAKGAEDAAIANKALGNVLKSMGMAQAADRVSAYAESLERTLAVDADVIKRTQTKLATFSNLTKTVNEAGGSFDRATKAALDMAAAGFGTAESNAVQLGKALQDPIKGITALGKAGVTFTDQEKEKIKALVESGNLLEAQNIVLQALETQVGGTAEASVSGFEKMRLSIESVKDIFGNMLIPVMDDLAPRLQNLSTWASENPQKLEQVAIAIGSITAAIVAMNLAWKATVFYKAAGALGPLGTLVAGFATAYMAIESFRLGVNDQYNKWVGYIEGTVNTMVKAFNPLIGLINKLIPGGDPLSKLGLIDIPRLDTTPSSLKGAGFAALDQIPQMANGGIVTSAQLSIIGEAGPEAVIPLDRLNEFGGGMNITVNAGLVSTPDQIGQEIIQAIQKAQRRSGVVFAPA